MVLALGKETPFFLGNEARFILKIANLYSHPSVSAHMQGIQPSSLLRELQW